MYMKIKKSASVRTNTDIFLLFHNELDSNISSHSRKVKNLIGYKINYLSNRYVHLYEMKKLGNINKIITNLQIQYIFFVRI